MKVLLVSSGSGSRGGGEIYLNFLAEGLSAAGCIVEALLPDASRMDELAANFGDSATVTRFPFTATYERRSRTLGALLDGRQQARLAARLAQSGADIIHVNQQVAEDGVDLVLAAARCGRPWVSTIHIGRSATSLGAVMGPLRDQLTKRVLSGTRGPFIAVSAASRDQLAERFGPNGPDLHVIHNGVPVPDRDGLAASRQKARADWGVGPDEIVVGAVGRIEAQKNPLALVDHLASATETGRRVRLVWIGDGAMRGELQAHAARVADRLPLTVDGWRQDAAARMAGFDVFLLPSRYEGLPLALLEAMHAGLPVIAARSDGIIEAVRHEETGLLCGAESEWRDAAMRLVGDEMLRVRLGAAAQADAQARFSIGAMAGETIDLYQRRIADFRRAA